MILVYLFTIPIKAERNDELETIATLVDSRLVLHNHMLRSHQIYTSMPGGKASTYSTGHGRISGHQLRPSTQKRNNHIIVDIGCDSTMHRRDLPTTNPLTQSIFAE